MGMIGAGNKKYEKCTKTINEKGGLPTIILLYYFIMINANKNSIF